MTEEEKARRIREFMEREREKLGRPAFHNIRTVEDGNALRRIARNQQLYASLAQQGHTWKDLKKAYDEAYARGRRDMLSYWFSFFYAAVAITYHESFNANPEEISDFIVKLVVMPEESDSHQTLLQRCLSETGVEIKGEEPTPKVRSTRKDTEAVERMRKSGITDKDMKHESEIGYRDGRNETFHLSSCHAATALALHEIHAASPERIEAFLERTAEIMDEEISAADIIERAKVEAEVDVSEIAKV